MESEDCNGRFREGSCLHTTSGGFANQPTVTLMLNGRTIGSAEISQGMAQFNVPLLAASNRLVAISTTRGTLIEVTRPI